MRRLWWLPPVGLYALLAVVGDRTAVDLGVERGAAHELFGSFGLHLYARAPLVQVGPLGLLAVRGLDAVSAGHPLAAMSVVAGALLALLLALLGRPSPTVALGGLLVAAAWAAVVPATGHLEDLLAVVGVVAALRTARSGHAVATGVLVGLATACKPWALLAVLVLAVPPARSRWPRGLGALVVVTAACWVPFLTVPGTVGALRHYAISAAGGSLPGLLGYDLAPSWVRPAQLLLAVVLGAVALRRGAWWAVPVAAFAARIGLDAGTYGYYAVGLVAGAYVGDVLVGRRLPLATLVAAVGLYATGLVADPVGAYVLRAAACAGAYLLLVAARPPTTATIANSAG